VFGTNTDGNLALDSGDVTENITVSSSIPVMPGQCVPLNVALPAPAPAPNGEYITLTSGDPTKFTFEDGLTSIIVPFAAGSTTPSGRPLQVCGVNFGTAIITAFGGTLSSGPTLSVFVTATLSFYPASVTVQAFQRARLTLILSSPAPAGGLTVNLSSANPSVASMPTTVTFPENSQTAIVAVTGVASGTTLVHASALPNVPDTTVSITVP
jgi:hypothetical protein